MLKYFVINKPVNMAAYGLVNDFVFTQPAQGLYSMYLSPAI